MSENGNGLTTRVALARLHDEIDKMLREYEGKYRAESCYQKLRSAFVSRYDSPLGWFAVMCSMFTIAALLTTDAYVAGICLAIILLIDLYVVVRENNLRRTEIYRKIREHALAELRLAEQALSSEWQPMNYPHLWCPISPCVSLQWTYRDGIIVNLPWALLVRGDHIVLRPGHITPGPCNEVGGSRSFKMNEIYGVAQVNDPPVKPSARAPLANLICCLQNTPYLDNLRIILEKNCRRPATIYNQQRYLLVSKYIQQWGFMLALGVSLFAGVLRMNGFGFTTQASAQDEQHYWKHVLIESPAAAVIPLLPLVFPIMWISMNLWGVARLQGFLQTPQVLIAKDSEKSFEEDLDTPTFDYENVTLKRSNVLRNWWQLWNGESELLPRSANLVQVLGSITALCCIDKKGILSWPNPTAEKIFFLHENEEPLDERTGSQSTINTESDVPHAENKDGGIVAEVLDLTHDQHCPFRLEFDDHEWKAHIKSLKPLGLAILLNTCSPLTHAHYAQFCGHVTAVAMLDKDLVPVTNRYAIVESSMNSFLHGRCLCELAKQIGFTDHATDRFALEGQLASYRHLQPDVVRRDIRFAKQLQLSTKVKVPFPHSLSVVMRENPGGYLSLFTQGTADIILDFCDDFWDGKDLRPLSPQDRKRALDFYQRSALTAYCTAFAYRPLRHGINGALSGAQHSGGSIAYLELPPESKLRMQHVDKTHCDFECANAKLSHSISTDSLLFSENKEDDVNDVDSCFEMQCHQVFIGMVTMQYQAQTDIVQLVERLDHACIRFVHFSKENELRSRVFSEKMGLESGWNCHISLLSEPNQQDATAGAQSPKHSTGKTVTSAPTTATTHVNSNNSCHLTTNTENVMCVPAISTTTSTNIITSTTTTTTITTNQHSPSTSVTCTHASRLAGHGDATTIDDDDLTMANRSERKGDMNCLLPPPNLEASKTLSSSAPGAISNQDYNMLTTVSSSNSQRDSLAHDSPTESGGEGGGGGGDGGGGGGDGANMPSTAQRRQSQDSAMDEDNCHSLSILTESTEQSAPINFDMSNRAKLPRGIENIRPHLEQVDNVPLLVSLFTDCSAEATREMLDIMQSYGEIVVCLGSSASNANADIFLQADCSIAVEPLYPQVCQDVPAYSESNLYNNKLRQRVSKRNRSSDISAGRGVDGDSTLNDDLLENGMLYGMADASRPMLPPGHTVSPIYLSRMLNALPCSIAVCREDPLSLVAIIELSRRFSAGLWNCIQFWACCAGSLAAMNTLSACLSLPALVPPLVVLYLMCVPVPLIAVALAHIDVERALIMNRATGKKQTEYDTRVFGFVVWCYGAKFFAPILIIMLSYCAFMAQPVEFIDVDIDELHTNLHLARIIALPAVLLHFIVVSSAFVHRDHSIWQRNPFRNHIWLLTCLGVILLHSIVGVMQLFFNEDARDVALEVWPVIVFLYAGCLVSLFITEIAKWQEIKVNTRTQRRARLDFGTKLGMNSPF